MVSDGPSRSLPGGQPRPPSLRPRLPETPVTPHPLSCPAVPLHRLPHPCLPHPSRSFPASSPSPLASPARPVLRPLFPPQAMGEWFQPSVSLCAVFAGSSLDLASTTAPDPGNQPLSFRKPPVSRSVPSVPSVPNVTPAGPPFPAGGAPTAGPPACAPPTPLQQTAGALKPDVALLLREMQLLQGLLSRVVLELKETQPLPGHTVETPSSHSAVSQGTPETTTVES